MADKVPRIQVMQGDIIELDVAAVVTAANEGLLGGGGVDGAVHAAAGPELLKACQQVAPCPTGESRITPAFDLAVNSIIHSVGPVYRDGKSGEPEQLGSAYRSALEIAAANEFESIAFPCISTGTFGYPADEAAHIAIETVSDWVENNPLPRAVVFCCFDQSDFDLYESMLEGEPNT